MDAAKRIEHFTRKVLDQLRQVGSDQVGGDGGVATPVSLALLDLATDLGKMEAGYEVVVGDWDVRRPGGKPSNNAAGRRNTAVVDRFARSRGLVGPLKEKLDWSGPEPTTYRSGKNESWIDYYLVSSKLVDRGLVKAAEILGEPLNAQGRSQASDAWH